MRLHGYSTNQRTATPYEQHTKNDARAEIDDGGCPVTLVAQHPEVVGKGGEGRETSTETGDEQHILARGHDMGLLQQAEEESDDETSDYVDKESSNRKTAVKHPGGPFSGSADFSGW